MRMLLDDPGQISPVLYRRFLRRSLFHGLTAGVVTGKTSSYLNLNALVLSRAEVESLEQISAGFARIFAAAGRRVAADVDMLVAYGFPWSFAELLHQESERPIVFGRFDFLIDETRGWQLVEYNSDTPSGIREGTAVDEAAFALLRPHFGGERINGRLGPQLAARHAGGAPRSTPSASGIRDRSRAPGRHGQTAYNERLINAALAGEGVETVLGDMDNLSLAGDGRVALLGQPLEALYRYYPYESMLGLPQFWMIVEAVAADRLCLLNGFRGLLQQNKGLLAWIWAHRDDPVFSPEEQSLICQHLPPTWWVRELPDQVDRRRMVAKQVFGREGEEVYFGDSMSEDDWRKCYTWGTFVAQQRVEPPLLDAVGWDLEGKPEMRRGWATVGSFITDDRWAGCYTRLGDRIVTSLAEFLPTFVEG